MTAAAVATRYVDAATLVVSFVRAALSWEPSSLTCPTSFDSPFLFNARFLRLQSARAEKLAASSGAGSELMAKLARRRGSAKAQYDTLTV